MPKLDRWLLWPTLVSLAAVTAVVFFVDLPGIMSFLVIPVVFLVFPVATIVIAVCAAKYLLKRLPRKAVSLVLAVLLPLVFLRPIGWVAECFHLGLTTWFGLGQLGPAPKPREDGFEVFDWSTGLAGGASTFLIRDPTDGIALSENRLSRADDPSGFFQSCAGKARYLLDHYYVCVVE